MWIYIYIHVSFTSNMEKGIKGVFLTEKIKHFKCNENKKQVNNKKVSVNHKSSRHDLINVDIP